MSSSVRHIITSCLGAIALLGLWSCVREPLDDNLALENYTVAFIKQFGLISPDQDWSDAKQTYITVDTGASSARDIKVLCDIDGRYYLLATASNVSGRLKVKFDMPEFIKYLIVLVDGREYYAEPASKVDVIPSRAEGDDSDPGVEANPLKWLLIAEDLGDIGDFDFNDFIAQITMLPAKAIEFDPSYKDYEDVDGGGTVLSRAGEVQELQIKALAAGGTMKLFLHYRSYKGDDYIIGPGNPQGYILTRDITSAAQADQFEWHKWFTDDSGRSYPHTTMVNTGSGARELNGTGFTLPVKDNNMSDAGVIDADFSMENYSVFDKKGEGRFRISRGFYLTVNDYIASENNSGDIVFGQVIGRTNRGDAPQMLAICDIGENGAPWSWPIERRNIASVYPLFKKWSASNNNNTIWYQTPAGQPNIDYYVRRN